MIPRRIPPAIAALTVCALPAIASAAAPAILADTNGDGRITGADRAGRHALHPTRIARYLPNLDDDAGRCLRAARRIGPRVTPRFTPAERAAEVCGDGRDDRVNGRRDVADLARVVVRPMRGLADGATARLTLHGAGASNSRLFVRTGTGWVPAKRRTLNAVQLRRGVTAGIEGRELARTARRSYVTVRVTVRDRGRVRSDDVAFRLARFRPQTDLMPATRVLAQRLNGDPAVAATYPSTLGPRLFDPRIGVAAPGRETETPGAEAADLLARGTLRGQADFLTSLRGALETSGARLHTVAGAPGVNNLWTQDQFELGWVEVPRAGGRRQRMRVVVRPPLRSDDYETGPVAGRLALTRALGHRDLGVADIPAEAPDAGSTDEALNLGGNLESVPAWPGHPHGAIVVGDAPGRRPDPGLLGTMRAQSDTLVRVDVSWLEVGHADEITHVFRAANPRGWTVAVADPRLGVTLLRRAQAAGAGGLRLGDPSLRLEGRTVDAMLADATWTARNEAAAVRMDAVVASLSATLGLPPGEIVRLPVLMAEGPRDAGARHGARYEFVVPDAVNGLSVHSRLFLAPRQHTVSVGGTDAFEAEVRARLAAVGVETRFVEARVVLNANGGAVHCGTNALRVPPATG